MKVRLFVIVLKTLNDTVKTQCFPFWISFLRLSVTNESLVDCRFLDHKSCDSRFFFVHLICKTCCHSGLVQEHRNSTTFLNSGCILRFCQFHYHDFKRRISPRIHIPCTTSCILKTRDDRATKRKRWRLLAKYPSSSEFQQIKPNK